MTLPPMRALGKTRERGKKRTTDEREVENRGENRRRRRMMMAKRVGRKEKKEN